MLKLPGIIDAMAKQAYVDVTTKLVYLNAITKLVYYKDNEWLRGN